MQGKILEDVVFDVDQGDCTEKIGAIVCLVVVDNDLVATVTLESYGVYFGLSYKILGKDEILISAGTEMESGRSVDTAEFKGGEDFLHVSEVGVGATYRVIAVQDAIAGEADITDGVVAMVAINLTVTGGDVSGYVVVTFCRNERT